MAEGKVDRAGPTGRFPQGRFHETDDGELAIMVAVVRRKIVIEFGVSTKWIAMDAQQARELGQILQEKADEAIRKADA